MGSKNLHEKPFDEGTLAKLEIFEDYAEAWLPTFIMRGDPQIHIFDFFSGPGCDSSNVPGSPIRLLEKIKKQQGRILQKKSKIFLHLNEYEPNRKVQNKYKLLVENCKNFIEKNPKFKYFLELKYYNQDTEALFNNLLPQIEKYPSLVYMDQSGVKFISKKYIETLSHIKTTDFLFFVSSSYFKRLSQTEEFQQVLKFTSEEITSIEYRNIHKIVVDKIKSSLEKDSEVMLFPFSIKKGANIYGIIFGATHYRAVDKFLSISWKKNEINGSANFDIDDDISKAQLSFFEKSLTKIEKFKNELENKIINGIFTTNKQVLIFTYETGNYYRHASELLRSLKKQKKIFYDGKTPGISYDYVFNEKKKRLVEYKKA